jgi:uncharacterized protein (DUF1499 family)
MSLSLGQDTKVKITMSFLLLLFLGLMVYIRLAPSDPARWHIALDPRPPSMSQISLDRVIALEGAAYTDLPLVPDIFAQLKSIAAATPRTSILSEDTNHITFVTRSKWLGFPDYTTAQITPSGLTLFARLRFGRSDLGVNAARLAEWRNLLAAS